MPHDDTDPLTKKGLVRKATIQPEDEEMFRRAREAEPSKIISKPEDTTYAFIYSGWNLAEDPSSEGKLTRKDKASIREHTPIPYGIFSVPSLGEEGPGDYQDTHAYKFDSPAYRKWIKTSGGDREVPKVFYHITPVSRVKNILRKGLVPGSANVAGIGIRLPGIYVTDNAEEALKMFSGGYEAETTRERKFALLEVRPTKDCYVAGDPELTGMTDEEIGSGYILYCTIPPQNIKVLKTFSTPSNTSDPVKIKASGSAYEDFLAWKKSQSND